MAPKGLAILIGAGPTSGAGIARILAHPSHGNMAVALLARNKENLENVTESVRKSCPGGLLHAFPSDTSSESLSRVFQDIAAHEDFKGLKLRLAIWHIKHSSKKPFLQETPEAFGESIEVYIKGAYTFAREALKRMYDDNGGPSTLSENPEKKGTIIFTGTLGAMRTNAEFASYGAGRSGVRMVAEALGKEVSKNGVHVVHTIANGAIRDEDSTETRTGLRMRAETVGKTYLWLANQEPDLWTHELDLRPAQEKY